MDYTSLLVHILAPLAVIVVIVYALVLKASNPESMLRPLPAGLTPFEQQTISGHREWLAYYNLQFLTCFQYSTIRVAVFQQQGMQRFLSLYFHQKLSYSIETYFDDLTSLDTSTSGSVGMFPARPGNYKQSCPGARVDEAWRRHLEAEDYLMKKFGFQFRPLSQSYEQTLMNVMRLQMQHVRSLRFWPFRAIYWYHVNRSRMANKSIQQQYP